MAIEINQDTCCGSGLCAVAAPAVFGLDDDGFVRLLATDPPAELDKQVREAADLCPTESIRLID
jgi:ferredoxin